MDDVIGQLLLVIVATITVPIYTIIGLLFLQSERGRQKASALIAGAVTIRLIQGVLFGFIFGQVEEKYPDAGPDILVAILLLTIGMLLLTKAYQAWRKEPDPEDSLPTWMSSISESTATKAAGVGALYVLASPKQWVFTQIALGIIIDAEVGPTVGTALYLFFVLGTQITLLIPLILVTMAPQRMTPPLQSAFAWLGRHNQTILMIVSLVFGLWFTYKGISSLLV